MNENEKEKTENELNVDNSEKVEELQTAESQPVEETVEELQIEEKTEPVEEKQPVEEPVQNTETQPEVKPESQPVEEPVAEQQPEQKTESQPEVNNNVTIQPAEKKKPSILKILLLVLLPICIIFLLLFLFLFHNFYMLNGKSIVKKEVKSAFNYVDKVVDNAEKNTMKFDLEKDSIGVSGDLSFESDYKDNQVDLSKLKNYSIKYDGVIDKSSNKLSGNVKLLKNKKDLLSVDGYLNADDLFFKSEQLFKSVLKTNVDLEIKDLETTKIDYDDIKKIVDKTERITLDSIDSKNIKKSTVKREINGKKVSVLKVSYKLDVNEYSKKIIDGYLKDEEVLTILADINNKTKNEMKSKLEDNYEKVEKNKEESTVTIDIFVDKLFGDFKELEISYDTEDYDFDYDSGDFKPTKIKNSIVITKDKENYKFYYKQGVKTIYTGSYNTKEKELTFDQSTASSETKVVIKQESKNSFKIDTAYSQGSVEISVTTKISNVVKDSEQETKVNVSFDYKYGKDKITGSLESNTKIAKDKKVTAIDSKNAKHVDDLTEDETMELYNNLMDIYNTIIKDIAPGYGSEDIATQFRSISDSVTSVSEESE